MIETHMRELNRDDPQEVNLVLAGWLRTYVAASVGVERSVFFRLCQPVVKALMAANTVVVATLPEAHDAVLGWVCFDGTTIDYVCVKPRWQRLGVATQLLADFRGHDVSYTHKTHDGERLMKALGITGEYEPLARFQEAE